MELVFATNNSHKLKEIRSLLGDSFIILSLADIGFDGEIPETKSTIEGNASQKAFYIHDKFGKNCFADDTGLEIDALDGSPGVISARYAGEHCSFKDNITKVLAELDGVEERNARFRTIISLVINGEETQFEGIVNGRIIEERRGADGFGYDPVFLPEGYKITFAEMDLQLKNGISHRGIAVRKLAEYLQSI